MLYVDWVSVDLNLTSRVFSGHSGLIDSQSNPSGYGAVLLSHILIVFRGRAPNQQHSSFGPTSLSCALGNSVYGLRERVISRSSSILFYCYPGACEGQTREWLPRKRNAKPIRFFSLCVFSAPCDIRFCCYSLLSFCETDCRQGRQRSVFVQKMCTSFFVFSGNTCNEGQLLCNCLRTWWANETWTGLELQPQGSSPVQPSGERRVWKIPLK